MLAIQPVVVGSITSVRYQCRSYRRNNNLRAATPVKAGAATGAGVAAIIAVAAKAAVVAAAPPTAERVFEGSLRHNSYPLTYSSPPPGGSGGKAGAVNTPECSKSVRWRCTAFEDPRIWKSRILTRIWTPPVLA